MTEECSGGGRGEGLWTLVTASPGPSLCPAHLTRALCSPLQGGLIALLLLLLVFMVALYAQRRWHKRRRIPQKSASTEATHEIHYIPSVLLGPQARESFRNSRLQAHNSVIGVPIRETPILDDYEDEEEEETPRRADPSTREDEFGSQVTRTLESLGRGGEEKTDYEKKGLWLFFLFFPSHPLPGYSSCAVSPAEDGSSVHSPWGCCLALQALLLSCHLQGGLQSLS